MKTVWLLWRYERMECGFGDDVKILVGVFASEDAAQPNTAGIDVWHIEEVQVQE